MKANTPEPPPIPNDKPALWELVIADARRDGMAEYLVDDMRARDKFGREKYGTPLQAGNGRDALADAYQELLDAAVYFKQAVLECPDYDTAGRHARTRQTEIAYADTLRLALTVRRLLWQRDGL